MEASGKEKGSQVKERNIQQRIRLDHSKAKTRLFNNDQGVAEVNGRRISYGLGNGSTDLVGVHTVMITPEMVGREVGIAVFAEVKTDIGRVEPHQQAFMDQMARMGCISGVVRSSKDMAALLETCRSDET